MHHVAAFHLLSENIWPQSIAPLRVLRILRALCIPSRFWPIFAAGFWNESHGPNLFCLPQTGWLVSNEVWILIDWVSVYSGAWMNEWQQFAGLLHKDKKKKIEYPQDPKASSFMKPNFLLSPSSQENVIALDSDIYFSLLLSRVSLKT